jgi:hypothetical protein
MNNKEKIKYFYEYITSNNCIDEVSEYVSDSCTVRIGEQIFPFGVDGMKQHMADIRSTYPE